MKKNVFKIAAFVLLALTASLANAQTFSYPVKGQQGFHLTEKTRDGVHVTYNLGQFSMNQLNYRGEAMSEISISAITLPNTAGCPNLPTESRMIAIPQGAKATLKVVSYETELIKDVNLAPALRIQAEDETPDMNYVKDSKVYEKNAFYPENPFVMDASYIRGVDVAAVAITPFQYNPVTKELLVYKNVELSLTYEGGNGQFGDDRLRSPYWDPILASQLANYDQLPTIDYAARLQQWLRDDAEGAEYIIVTPNNDAWAEYANQLKDHRMRQGIITKVYRLDEMPATTTNAMKAWFHNAYNTWEIAPVAVCLLGDHGTNMSQYIPAESVSHPYDGSCITDNGYADPSGDNLPDMVFSRLVAETAEQLPVIVGKQLEYEYSNPNMDPSSYTRPVTALGWQTERWFQLCSEVVGGYLRNKGYDVNRVNCIYEGSPGNSWSSSQNTNQVVNYFGPNGVGYIPATPSELGGWTGGTPDQIVTAVNNGAFLVQHRDHGLEEGWGEPAMRNSHVLQTTNVGKLPFVMSINCSTGKFNYSTNCFCEAWMRHTYNGQNAGAVGVICPTAVSYSFVNDAYVWGVYDLFDGNFMPDYGPYAQNTGNWMPAFGNVAGKYFLQQSSWPWNPESKDITYTMFTAHCDAFLRLYTQVPQDMEVTHPEVVLAGRDEINVTAPEGCTISLVVANLDGGWDILAVAQATGDNQIIEFEPQLPPTEINIVVTGQNYLRYEAVMLVVPDDGPYIVYDSKVLNDENGNGQLDFGETISMDITLRNVGSENMNAFEAVLSTESEYVTIINGSAQYESIAPEATATVENAFSFRVADDIPDMVNNSFTITVVNGEDTYTSKISMKAFSPVLAIGNMSITEVNGNGNGRLDPGEDAELNFAIENKGHSDAHLTSARLTMLSPYITLEQDEIQLASFAAGSLDTITYAIHISEDTPSGYSCPILLNVNSDSYGDQKDFAAKVGLIIEDFELGELGDGWSNDNSHPWTFVTEEPYEGQYCLRSGSISDNGTTQLTLRHEAGCDDEFSFFYKVSSESNYDKLHFYIDNVEKDTWSGTIGWTQVTYPVSAGSHLYKWTYTKDGSVSSGNDCAWIDYISLPSPKTMAGTAGPDVNICEGNDAQIVGYAIHHQSLAWSTAGDGTFDDATIATPIYTPGTQDLAARSVVLTITINGEDGNVITDDMTINIFENVEVYNAIPEVQYCAVSEPQAVEIGVTGDYTSVQWTTSGDGFFEDATESATVYTAGPNDIANGVSLTATVNTAGCGPVVFEYPFEMNPTPNFNLVLPNCNMTVAQGQDYEIEYTATGFINGTMSVEINGVAYTLAEGETTLTLQTGEEAIGMHDYLVTSADNGICTQDLNETIAIEVMPAPAITAETTSLTICEGETAQFELHLTGAKEGLGYQIAGEGLDTLFVAQDDYTLVLTPSESTEIHIDYMRAHTGGCNDHLGNPGLTLSINIVGESPLNIIGENDLDAYYTPSSEYTVEEDLNVIWSMQPAEAGTLQAANDGKSVLVNWAEQFKGTVTLTATPNIGCEVAGTDYIVNVTNSYDVSEYNINANIFPNPTNGNVTIQAKNMTRLSVVNGLGQVVYDAELDGDECTVNMSQFGVGIYMVRITTAQGNSTKQVTVVR